MISYFYQLQKAKNLYFWVEIRKLKTPKLNKTKNNNKLTIKINIGKFPNKVIKILYQVKWVINYNLVNFSYKSYKIFNKKIKIRNYIN